MRGNPRITLMHQVLLMSSVAARGLIPKIWLLTLAPARVLLVSQLHSLIAIKIHTEVEVFVIRKSKPKRLYSFAIRGEHDKVAVFQIQVLNPDWLFVWPENRLPLVDSDRQSCWIVLSAGRKSSGRFG